MLLSVIIVSYRQIPILRDCLDSIGKFNDIGDELEVIVSDNSPDTELYQTIEREYPWVVLVKNGNIGFGAGNNRGYAASSGKYLLFLNPDTVITEPVFGFAIREFEDDPDLAMFGIQQKRPDGSDLESFNFLGFVRPKNLFELCRLKRCYKIGKFMDGEMFLGGPDLFIRRDSFEEAGKFDENIFMYYEEEDLTRRIKLYSKAKKMAFYPQKQLIHLGGGTEEKNEEARFASFVRGNRAMEYVAAKYGADRVKLLKIKKRKLGMRLWMSTLLFKKDRRFLKRKLQYYRERIKALREENE